jgi:carboxypeptidase C (cathepsin A)
VPTIAKKIYDMNSVSQLQINLVGIGIGNGYTDPEHASIYADYLYQVT